jgi:hypothetical protein
VLIERELMIFAGPPPNVIALGFRLGDEREHLMSECLKADKKS